jgi:lysophospholipase L1-like esterase
MFRRSLLRPFHAFLLALVALGAGAQVHAQSTVRIMPLGDSITAGPGCWRAYLWGLLQNNGYTNLDFVGGVSDGGSCNPGFPYDQQHEGHSGFAITGIADANQLPPWLSANQPDIVVMHLGTNDMWGGWIPLDRKITALDKLITQMREYRPTIRIVMAMIIPMDADGCTTCMNDVIAFNQALGQLANSRSSTQSPIYVANLWNGFDVVADTYDRVHPVTSGFVKMANAFYPSVAAAINSARSQLHLTVLKQGTGAGTVTSNSGGINCGSACGANYSNGATVTLTATAASGSTFAGWGGACTNTTGTCTVSMTVARTVYATFNVSGTTSYWLTTTKSGTGAGTITTFPGGLNCGSTCSAAFVAGTSVTITATPAANSVYTGGLCGNPCTVVMDQPRGFAVSFASTTNYSLTVAKAGAGSGVVTSNPSGINCGSACSASFANGTSVTLTASPASNATFTGWSGACSGTGACVVTMNQARSVTATFNTSGGTGGACSNPVTFSGNTGNFNTTGAACYRTSATVNGWGCYNMDGRTITVGGVARTCGQTPLTRSADGSYSFAVTAGQFPWAGIYTW